MKILTSYDRLDNFYYTAIDILRYIAFFTLVSISMLLSISFYMSAVEDPLDKILLGFAAASLEIVKVYTLIFSEYIWYTVKQKAKLTYHDVLRAARPYILFALLTLLSIVASIAFAQASIYSTIEEVQIVVEREADIQENPLIDAKTKLLVNKQNQLEMLNSRIALLPADYVTASLKLSDEVNQLNEDIYKISEEIALLETKAFESKVENTETMSEKKATYNRFKLLGEPIGLNETQTLFTFLTLFAVLLEMGIIATAPAPEKRSIKELIGTRIKENVVKKVPKKTSKKNVKKAVVKPKKASIAVETIQPKIEAKEVIKTRGTSVQLFEELYEAGHTYLKSPSTVSYTSKRTTDEYLHLLARLSRVRPNKDSAYLISKDAKGYKMNYNFNYIKSRLKEIK